MTEAPALFAIWLLGASMGLTACSVTCLPFMGTWMVARPGGSGARWRDTAGFVGGRILAYTLLGALAASGGQAVMRFLDQGLGHLIIGGASIAAALWLLAGPARPSQTQPSPRATPVRFLPSRPSPRAWQDSAPPLAVGFSLALVPCTPLGTLLAACAQTGIPRLGALQGLCFGLGAAVTPLLLLLPLLGTAGAALRRNHGGWRRPLTWCGAAILMALGVRQCLLGLANQGLPGPGGLL